jgi:hypothetical protein
VDYSRGDRDNQRVAFARGRVAAAVDYTLDARSISG